MTQPLFDAPSEPKLTAAQQRALEFVRERDSVSAYEVGVVAGAREPFIQTRGNQILRALRKKGLVKYKQRLGWVTADWRADDDGAGPGDLPEGF